MKIIIIILLIFTLYNCELIDEHNIFIYEVFGTVYTRISYVENYKTQIIYTELPWTWNIKTTKETIFIHVEKINPSLDLITVNIYLNNTLVKTKQSSNNIFMTYP